MKENIYFSSPEGQEFQTKPHVSIMKSREFPKTWQIDLRWREDNSSERIDAEFNFVDGLTPLTEALKESFFYARILNLPVAKYEDNSMEVLRKPGSSTAHQNSQLEFLKSSEGARRFLTH
jgi:hypothetical protein